MGEYGIYKKVVLILRHTKVSIEIDIDRGLLVVGYMLMKMFYLMVLLLYNNYDIMCHGAKKIRSLCKRRRCFVYGIIVKNKCCSIVVI